MQEDVLNISEEQLERTFRTNIFGYIFMIQAAVPHLKEGSAIINTTRFFAIKCNSTNIWFSITAYKGEEFLIDYTCTKGAIRALTYSLSKNLVKKGIRVNAVAPGPIWTPFIPSTFPEGQVKNFDELSGAIGRTGQPEEVAPCYTFLASQDSSYMTGQIMHPNGGFIVNG